MTYFELNDELNGYYAIQLNLKREVLSSLPNSWRQKTLGTNLSTWKCITTYSATQRNLVAFIWQGPCDKTTTWKLLTDASAVVSCSNDYLTSVFLRSSSTAAAFECSSLGVPNISIGRQGIFEAPLSLRHEKRHTAYQMYSDSEHHSVNLNIFIFTGSIEKGEIPYDWKTANVALVHKSGDKFSIKHYRHISLLCTYSKLQGHCFQTPMFSLGSEQLLPIWPTQLSPRLIGSNTIPTIIGFAAALDKGGEVHINFLNFEKALDKILHSKLTLKSRNLLKNNKITRWLSITFSIEPCMFRQPNQNRPFYQFCQ